MNASWNPQVKKTNGQQTIARMPQRPTLCASHGVARIGDNLSPLQGKPSPLLGIPDFMAHLHARGVSATGLVSPASSR